MGQMDQVRTRQQLSNGVTLIIQENHFNPTVSIVGYLKAGSIYDGASLFNSEQKPPPLGTADFVAEMLMNGTTTRTWQQIAGDVESVGATIDIWGQRETIGIVSDLLVRDFDTVLDVLQDVLRNPTFPVEEIDKHRYQLHSAFMAWEDDTYSVSSRMLQELVYPEDHPYHHRVQGTEDSINQIAQQTLIDFHERLYRPDRLVLVITGDVDTNQVISKMGDVFGDWSVGLGPETESVADLSTWIPEVLLGKPTKQVHSMMDKSQVDIALGHKGVTRSNPDCEALYLMNQVLGGSAGIARLFNRVRDIQGLAYSVWSSLTPATGEGAFTAGAGVDPKNVDRAVESIVQEIRAIKDQGITSEELSDVQNLTVGNFVLTLETNKGVASALSIAQLHNLGLDYIDRHEEIYRQITLDQVNAVAQKYLFPDQICLAIAGPYQADITTSA